MEFEHTTMVHMNDICTILGIDNVYINGEFIIFTDDIYMIEDMLYQRGFTFDIFLHETLNHYYVVNVKFINTDFSKTGE
jgi:hypothetical protein